MTVKEHLENIASGWIAKQLWGDISTELDGKIMRTHELDGDLHKSIPWILNRIDEMLKDYFPEKVRKKSKADKPAEKEVVNEEETTD